ncbi:hypothetical protein PHYC_03160 [Phycisphaerales bacterium]|nr:hypothetical protein PHYC_03160 [Phycisphaerales bacterium]
MAPKPLLDRALARARRILAAGDKSEAELRARLARAGFEHETIDTVVLRLRASRALDDARLAQAVLDQSNAAAESPERARERLHLRGLKSPGVDSPSLALTAARAAAEKAPSSLAPAARYRRVLAALARKGYDEETALDAARRVLGPIPAPDEP